MPRKKAVKRHGRKSHARKSHSRKTMSAVDIFSESIKATFDWNIIVIPLMTIVFGLIAMFIISIISLPFIAIGAIFIATTNIASLVAIAIIGVLIFLVLAIVSTAIINGFYYKSVDQYLKEKKVSIEENIKFAFGKWQKLVGISLLEILVSSIIMFLVIFPAMSFIIGINAIAPDAVITAVESASETALITALIPTLVVLSLAFVILITTMLFINPLLFLWFATAVFEKKPVLECVRKGYDIGKAKYLRNFGALILMGIVGAMVVAVQMIDPTVVIGIVFGIWIELATIIMIVKIYREGA